MKKILGIAALALTIGTSIIAGTMAVYNVELGTIAEGNVIAKGFTVIAEGSETFADDVKIAPTETITKTFTVSNFEGNVISETPMKTTITVDFGAADGLTQIPYLTATVYKTVDGVDQMIGSAMTDGEGSLTFEDGFTLSATGQTNTYNVVVSWPDTNATVDSNNNGISDDAEYSGAEYGNSIRISVTGTQVDNANDYIK